MLQDILDLLKSHQRTKSAKIEVLSFEVRGEAWYVMVVPMEQQASVSQHSFASKIAPVLQIIGDSGHPFLGESAQIARRILHEKLDELANHSILWGYTGYPGPGEDINQLVNEWIDNDPGMRSPRCYANLVSRGTAFALEEWGCRYPTAPASARNFILVAGDADFGDDTTTSDSLTNHLVVFEGGLQCLTQIANCLQRNCQITLIYGLRSANRFSASYFTSLLAGANTQTVCPDEYLASIAPLLPNQLAVLESTRDRLVSLRSWFSLIAFQPVP
jgi:hypothetical protein